MTIDRTTPLFIGTAPPQTLAPWTTAIDGNGSFGQVATSEGYFNLRTLDEADSDVGNLLPMTRVNFTIPITNTTDPEIIMATSFVQSASETDIGLLITGSTGQISANFSQLSAGNAPFTSLRLHTGLTDRGTIQNPVGAGPLPEGGLIWFKLTHDKNDSNRTRMLLSTDGTNFIQVAADELLDIGTPETCGLNFVTDTDASDRAGLVVRLYHFEQS